MTRKMAYIGFFYLFGLFSASFSGYYISIYLGIALIAAGAGLLAVRKFKYITLCVIMFSFAAGGIYYSLYDNFVYQNIIKYNGYDVIVKGKITAVNDYSRDMSRYEVKGIVNDDVTATVIFFADSADCKIGDNISVTGKASVMEDSYIFPLKSYYKSKGIYLQIEKITDFELEHADSFSIRRTALDYREYIYSRINKYMNSDALAVMSAILFGDKSGLEDDTRLLMQRAGIGHIMTVSGLHLALTCSFFWGLLSLTPLKKSARFCILLLPLCAFALLAGFTPPVTRSAFMIIIVYAAELFRRRADTLNSLGIAVIMLTASNPFAVRDASFLMSTAGVFGMGVLAPVVVNELQKIIWEKQKLPEGFEDERFRFGKKTRLLLSYICVVTAMFPVSFLFFDEISIISPLSNLFLLPICTVILIGGVIVTFTGGLGLIAMPILAVCGVCCELVVAASKAIGGLRFSYIPLGYDFAAGAVLICIVTVIAGAVILRSFRRVIMLWAFIFGFTVTVIFAYRFIPSSTVTAAVLHEGAASVLIIHDKNTASIVDLNRGGRAARSAVKYLNRLGIYDIEALYLNVNSNTSQPIYKDKLALFDVHTVLVPEEGYLRGGMADFGENTMRYSAESRIEMPYYALEFFDDSVLLHCRDSEILLYDGENNTVIVSQGETVIFTEDSFRALIYKDGKLHMSEVRSGGFEF
ncbi:MAG: ComEC family competence protein [Oscillospiraceae bacterium]|nr:ComEC family competence protein [Oscillospiraceae bacterium]